jgi:pimeloyl-ACP methyl ester carboxylesterase
LLNLVFIHGTGDDHRTWQRQREFFAGSHAVLDVDLPGRGNRVEEQPLHSHEDNARDVLHGMDAAGMPRATLIGHSAGGAVAILIALQSPARVLALVLVATGARLDVSPGVLDAARRRAEGHPDAPRRPIPLETVVASSTPPQGVSRLGALTMRAPPRAVYADLLANRRFDAVNRVAAITAPTLVIACSDDRLVPLPLAESLAASIPGAQLVILPECGHYPHVEQEAVFNFTLVKFLGRMWSGGDLKAPSRKPYGPHLDQGPLGARDCVG